MTVAVILFLYLSASGCRVSPPEPVAARGHVNGRGPQAKRSGRDEQSEGIRGDTLHPEALDIFFGRLLITCGKFCNKM